MADERTAAHRRNTALAEAINAADWTYESVARAVRTIASESGTESRCNKSAVAHWVAGTRTPSGRTPLFLAEAFTRRLGRPVHPPELGLPSPEDDATGLDLTPAPLEVITRLGRADLERRRFLVNAVYSLAALNGPLAYRPDILDRGSRAASGGVLIGASEVEAVREMTGMLNRADEIHGGSHARSAVVAYLTTDVAAYCTGRFASREVRGEMFGAAAQLAYLAGFKAHDAGLEGLAERYYLQAFQLACESDPGPHAGYILRILAHQALDLGLYGRCVDLADAALQRSGTGVDSDTRSLFVLTRAHALAAEGEVRASMRELHRAEILLDRAGSEEAPGWAASGGPSGARLASNTGKILQLLGDHQAAERQFRRSTALWDPVAHRRIRGIDLAHVAEAQCAQGRLEQAIATWSRALDHMQGVRSARVRDALQRMRAQLASYQGRGPHAVENLERRARIILSAPDRS